MLIAFYLPIEFATESLDTALLHLLHFISSFFRQTQSASPDAERIFRIELAYPEPPENKDDRTRSSLAILELTRNKCVHLPWTRKQIDSTHTTQKHHFTHCNVMLKFYNLDKYSSFCFFFFTHSQTQYTHKTNTLPTISPCPSPTEKNEKHNKF